MCVCVCVCVCVLVVQLCPILWDPLDCHPPGSSVHGFFRKEYWSGLPFPSPGGLPDPGIGPWSCVLKADSLPLNNQGSPGSCSANLKMWNFFVPLPSEMSSAVRNTEQIHPTPPLTGSETLGNLHPLQASGNQLKKNQGGDPCPVCLTGLT